MRRIAIHFAGSQSSRQTREKYGLPTLDSARVRALTTEQGDGATCARLMRFVQRTDSALASPGMRLTFFEADRHYYVVSVRADRVDPPPPGVIRIGGWSVLWVVTAIGEPKLIARIAV